MAERVRIVEVGPRDGLQNEARAISVAEKVALIDACAEAGLPQIEVGSYVSPRWVPQMADTDRVLSNLRIWDKAKAGGGPKTWALVPNLRGLEALLAAPVRPSGIAVFVSATEGFSRANLNCSISESFERIAPVVSGALAEGLEVRGYLSCVIRCPFDGDVAPDAVAQGVAHLRDLAPMEVSLGDTIGAGVPASVAAMLEACLTVAPAGVLAGHFHDTSGRACDNVEAALEMGLRVFDAAVGGLGGCPYAPGAPGNVATEAVVERVHTLGYETGIDQRRLAEAAALARKIKEGA